MDPRQLFMDERLTGFCVYCGAEPGTREHVPSRILLDDPLPPNFDLPVVNACSSCNAGFSLDEEYLACFLECAVCDSVDPEFLQRKKIKRTLLRNTRLAARIAKSKGRDDAGQLVWQPEMDRVYKIIVKLARGHAAYELYPLLDEPSRVDFRPLLTMSDTERSVFESSPLDTPQLWPEIGTRAFLRTLAAFERVNKNVDWILVQPGRYRYLVNETGGVLVRMVLSEYLACMVAWG